MNIAKLVLLFLSMPVTYVVCFHFGWGRDVRSWEWIIGCWGVSLVWAVIHAMNGVWRTPFRRAIRTALYLGMIFSLSCLAIIYGWGMQPRSWVMIVVPYAMAASLPPFNQISRYLLWWRPQPRDEMFECVCRLRRVADQLIQCLPSTSDPYHHARLLLEEIDAKMIRIKENGDA